MTHFLRALVLLSLLAPTSRAAFTPTHLRTKTPRFSWTLESPDRAQKQSAYRIRVATDPAKLAANNADLWDTGKVPSADTTHIAYAGKPPPRARRDLLERSSLGRLRHRLPAQRPRHLLHRLRQPRRLQGPVDRLRQTPPHRAPRGPLRPRQVDRLRQR